MPLCCRCNATGKCINCACVKSKRPCTNCLPLRKGCCSNMKQGTALIPDSSTLVQEAISQDATSDATILTSTTQTPHYGTIPEAPHLTTPLPPPSPMATPAFMWDESDPESLMHSMNAAYAETVHWRKNTFRIPYGEAGNRFVAELGRLYRAYAEGTSLEAIALKATTVISILLLQKPFRTSKPKDHSACLKRRMITWKKGDINSLVLEGRSLQQRMTPSPPNQGDKDKENLARTFSRLMFQGKTNAALQLLSQKGRGGVLHANDPIDTNDPQSKTVPRRSNIQTPPSQTSHT